MKKLNDEWPENPVFGKVPATDPSTGFRLNGNLGREERAMRFVNVLSHRFSSRHRLSVCVVGRDPCSNSSPQSENSELRVAEFDGRNWRISRRWIAFNDSMLRTSKVRVCRIST